MKKIFNVIDKKLKDKKVLKACIEVLEGKGHVTKKYEKSVIARSKIASLYMGNGLIIPHSTEEGRDEIIGNGALLFTWFKEKAEFEGNEVDFAVTIAVSGSDHMSHLSDIAEKFLDKDRIDEVVSSKDEKMIKEFLGL